MSCSLLLAACQPRQVGDAAESSVLEGDFTVTYKQRVDEGTTVGDIVQAKRIKFCDGYVVVGEEDGGRVLPMDGMLRFRWRASK